MLIRPRTSITLVCLINLQHVLNDILKKSRTVNFFEAFIYGFQIIKPLPFARSMIVLVIITLICHKRVLAQLSPETFDPRKMDANFFEANFEYFRFSTARDDKND